MFGLTDKELEKFRHKYHAQKSEALKRLDLNGDPIQWQFTFESWIACWIESGQLFNRGPKKGQYVMSRNNDIGPYSIDNIKIVLSEINNKEKRGRVRRPKKCSHCGHFL